MKKYISFLICFATLLSLGACNDWLDVKPSTQMDRDELLSREEGYAEAIKGVYTLMCKPTLYGRELTWGPIDVIAGYYQTIPYYTYNNLQSFSWVKGSSTANTTAAELVGQFWTGLYNAIAGLNSVLDVIDDNKGIFTDDNYSLLKGEAMGLRAFLHFEVLRMFGDAYEKSRDKEVMPFVAGLSAGVAPMLKGEDVITIVISQLEEAVRLLETDPMKLGTAPAKVLASIPAISAANNIREWHNRRFHFNYYAAKATLARAYLWKGDKVNALKMAREVIADQQSRFPWAIDVNLSAIESGAGADQDRTFATEHIFALNVTDMDNMISGFLNKSGETYENYLMLSRRDDLFTREDERGVDPRYRFLYVQSAPETFLLSKFYQPVSVAAYFKYRMPLIRISEMYYIAAECAPAWQDGLEYLETVRRNRGMGTLPLVNVNDPETLQGEIHDEYRKEFAGEGQLWFYYKRRQFTELPFANMSFFSMDAYVFPRPENEDLYGNRN